MRVSRTERRSAGQPEPAKSLPRSGHPPPADTPPERSGEDTRRRGWFWHWNTIITQFAPLIGLKGVGLLNSYTVWTDRREGSPYQGYAFPSQHAEAAFYGEERAELITLNKILVALDLIEIRKEMVTRHDETGRRWRVPHNFYRVKDRPHGFTLTPEAVLRVVELAARDHAVYRAVRHIFSARFSPIDRDNIWHQILPVVRQHPTWQQLAQRAAEEEERASARTRAGHARRRPRLPAETVPGRHSRSGNSEAPATSVGQSNHESSVAVAPSNSERAVVVVQSNSDSTLPEEGRVGESSTDRRSSVAPANRTYYQQSETTTTTTSRDHPETDSPTGETAELSPSASPSPAGLASGPLSEPSPEVVACYEAANGRSATPLERQLLGELEREVSGASALHGIEAAALLVAAIREAVNSGSRFVAPKRIREILARWLASGSPPPLVATAFAAEAAGDPFRASPEAVPVWVTNPGKRTGRAEPDRPAVWPPPSTGHRSQVPEWRRAPPPVPRPSQLVDEGALSSSRGDPAVLAALPAEVVERITAALTAALGVPIHVVVPPSECTPARDEEESSAAGLPPTERVPPVLLPDGLTTSQLWAMAQEVLQGRLSPGTFESWIRPAMLLGLTGSGELVIGAPSQAACRRLEGRLRPVIESALSQLLGRPVQVRAAVVHEWLAQRRDRQGADDGSP